MSQPTIIGNSDLQSDRQLQEYKYVMNYKNDTERRDSVIFGAAIRRVLDKFKIEEHPHCPITHLLDIFKGDSMIVNWSESAGLPWCDLGYQTKEDIQNDPEAVRQVREFWHRVKDAEEIVFPDCTIHTKHNSNRTAFTTVWTYPATVHFGEAAFLIKLIETLREQDVLGMAYTSHVGGCNRLYERLYQNNKFYVKLDFNKNTVPAWIIKIAFDIITLNINFCKYVGEGIPDARKMYRMFDCIQEYFINTPIKLPNGTRIRKLNGIPDGSYFTELIGSVVSAIILEHLSLTFEGAYTEDYVVHGHECIARVRSYWDLNLCREILKNDYGMTLNLSRCQVSRNIRCIHFFRNLRV